MRSEEGDKSGEGEKLASYALRRRGHRRGCNEETVEALMERRRDTPLPEDREAGSRG